jgi:hypothetical protein
MTLGYPDPGDASSGVFRKVNNQLKTWNKLGHTTHWFAISQLPKTSDEAAHLELSRYQCGNSRMSRFRVCKDVFAGVLAWQPDIIYTRFGSYYPGLSQLMQKIPTILEANTNDLSEYQLMLPKYQFIFHKFTRNWTLNNSAGIVCVASELSELFALLPSSFVEGGFVMLVVQRSNTSEQRAFAKRARGRRPRQYVDPDIAHSG